MHPDRPKLDREWNPPYDFILHLLMGEQTMKTNRLIGFALICIMALGAAPASAAPVTLQNDTFKGSSSSVPVQGGFAAGEGFAAVFTPPSYPFVVKKVQVLIAPGPGGLPSTKKFVLTIYNDKAGSLTPGTALFQGDVDITSSTTALTEIDVTSTLVSAGTGDIRMAFVQSHKGTPSIVRDMGPRKAKKNLLYGNIGAGLNWYWLDTLSGLGLHIPGNWIIRVIGDAHGTTTGDSGTVKLDGSSTTTDTGVAQPDNGVAQPDGSVANPEAGIKMGGAGLTCLSKLCVVASPEEDGCSVAPAKRPGLPPLYLLLALGLLIFSRRRL